jgi:hypothetical protein
MATANPEEIATNRPVTKKIVAKKLSQTLRQTEPRQKKMSQKKCRRFCDKNPGSKKIVAHFRFQASPIQFHASGSQANLLCAFFLRPLHIGPTISIILDVDRFSQSGITI